MFSLYANVLFYFVSVIFSSRTIMIITWWKESLKQKDQTEMSEKENILHREDYVQVSSVENEKRLIVSHGLIH